MVAVMGIQAADLRDVAIYVVCLVIAISVHEFAHALAADRLGDPTPSRDGRLTLNPMSHADPVGTLLLPVMAGLFKLPLLGWGRPVATQPSYYTRKVSLRGGLALVAFAGPLSNFVQAALTLAVWKGLVLAGMASDGLFRILGIFFQLNLVLMAFNLLPLHPLDGGKILSWMLPTRLGYIDDFLARYGGIILLVLVLALPQVLWVMLSPVMSVGRWAMRTIGL